jgi:Fur family ferric uptake transcriptional regulator
MSMRKLREETEHFYSYLRQNALKKTYQKDLILETFLNTEGHLSVEDIYALVKKRDKKVGVVTVFRTLKSLTACGIAREINLGDGLTRFEHSYHHPVHHHIVCTECHRAIEFVCPALEEIQNEIIQKYHFQPMRHRFQTYGICEDCRENRPVQETPKQDTERIFARDAIKMALSMENRCLAFYRESASRNLDAEGGKFFEKLIQQEETHIAELNVRLEELVNKEKDLDRAPVFLHFNACDLDALLPEISTPEAGGDYRLNAQDARELALAISDKTTEYFTAYANRFVETQGKKVLLEFVEQERSHGELIRQRKQEA